MKSIDSVPRIAISKLKPYKNNARVHSDDQIARLVASIQEFGWTRPIIVDEKMMVLAGHGCLEAAKAMGEDTVPVIVKEGLSAKQKRAYILADNKLAEHSKWDEGLLRTELLSLDIDLAELTGFKSFELAKFTRPGEIDPALDEPVEPPKTTTIVRGDLFQLGDHRLMCGDCCNEADVLKLGNSTPVQNLMVTDPPYGVDYDPEWRAEAGVNKNRKKMGAVVNDWQVDWSAAYKLFVGDVVYVYCASWFAAETQKNIIDSGFDTRNLIVWAKDRFSLSRGDYHWQHELLWYGVRHGKKSRWSGDRSQSTLWTIPARDDSGHGHSTQKPIECMRRPILNNSKKGDAVYDPFVGSGTTIIACEAEERICYAMEINPLYVQMTIDRWEKMTSKTAVKL